jgi:drug/metabolite transporter (DMT)-like permease
MRSRARSPLPVGSKGEPTRASVPARPSNNLGGKLIFLDKGLYAALLYSFLSLAMTLINKHLVKDLSFTFESSLISLQMLLSVILLFILSWLRIISPLQIPRSIYSIGMALAFFVYVLFGWSSLRLMTGMPIWTAWRRLTALFVMACDMAFRGEYFSWHIWLSCCCMMMGAVIGAAHDPSPSSREAFLHVLVLCAASALYLVLAAKLKKSCGSDDITILYTNSLLSLPLFVLHALSSGELTGVQSYSGWSEPRTIFWVALSIFGAIALNYSVFLNISTNSPLTASVAGQIKNVMAAALSFFFDPPSSFPLLYVAGLIIALAGSCWYSAAKYFENYDNCTAISSNRSRLSNFLAQKLPVESALSLIVACATVAYGWFVSFPRINLHFTDYFEFYVFWCIMIYCLIKFLNRNLNKI